MAHKIIRLAAVLGALSVALGAFGAHLLKDYVSAFPDAAKRMEWWEKAVDYHMAHTLLLLGIGILAKHAPLPLWRYATLSLSFGIVVFSGSLYIMTITGLRWLGAITPIGGIALIIGWLILFVGGRRLDAKQKTAPSAQEMSSPP